jgi:protein-serine/threonine kinase
MQQMHGGHQDNGADNHQEEVERGRGKLLPPLSLPKNRSTSNLPGAANPSDKSRLRMSFDAASMDYESITRLVAARLCRPPTHHHHSGTAFARLWSLCFCPWR